MHTIDTIFILVIVVFSAIVHEVMHGVAALWLGDSTARYAGRLTLNPLSHIDPFGSIMLPLALALSSSPIFFAYAKPVPYNPYNLRNDGLFGRFGEAIVASAGPFSNLVIALVFGLIIRADIATGLNEVFFSVVLVNVMLALFNIIPIPPLDGSKVLAAFLPSGLAHSYAQLRMNFELNPILGMGIVVFIVYAFGSAYSNFIYLLAQTIAG